MNRKDFFNIFKDPTFWINLCIEYVAITLMLILDAKPHVTALIAIIIGIGIAIYFVKNYQKGNKEIATIQKELKKAMSACKKSGDATIIYKALDDVVLPAARKMLPQYVYKYYPLGQSAKQDQQNIDSIQNKTIWASVGEAFNDPFECQYMFLTEDAIRAIGFQPEAFILWNKVMSEFRKRITITCFTQNPNHMPMWAHYANNHQGFCVKYRVTDTSPLYPVIYSEKRQEAYALFINLFYELFNTTLPPEQRSTAINHLLLTCAFKDLSWKSENEIRFICLNSITEMMHNGKLFTCPEAGICAEKIYIGVACSKENEQKLKAVADNLKIDCEKCAVSESSSFSVVKEDEYA